MIRDALVCYVSPMMVFCLFVVIEYESDYLHGIYATAEAAARAAVALVGERNAEPLPDSAPIGDTTCGHCADVTWRDDQMYVQLRREEVIE